MAMIVDAYQFSFIGAMFFPSYFCVASGASAFIDYTSFLFYFFLGGGSNISVKNYSQSGNKQFSRKTL